MAKHSMQAEVEKNHEAFEKILPQLMRTHEGKYALLRDRNIVELFDSFADAEQFGSAKFADDICLFYCFVEKQRVNVV